MHQGGKTMVTKKFAVLLSGCGHQDGAEIHEATLTLWAIHKNGADFQCFAPDIPQYHVINHLTGQTMDESRHVRIEAARIARGDVLPLSQFNDDEIDGLILPGGFGAAKNLCTYAFDGIDCQVNPEVSASIHAMHEQGKPIGALCIAPVILVKVLGDILVTIGQDQATAKNIVHMGGRHSPTLQGEVAVDKVNKIVTTPCYMLPSRVDQIAQGADKVVQEMLALMEATP